MKKRPLSIVLIALVCLLAPLGNILVAAHFNQLPLTGPNSIFLHLMGADWIILALFPVVGLGVYSVHKWGWYLFICFAGLLVMYNLYVYLYLNPNYPFYLVVAFILLLAGISMVFFRRHVYSPYFNPRLRWWEVAPRYKVSLETRIVTSKDTSHKCRLVDISESGCFIDFPGDLNEGSQVWVMIECVGVTINCLGKVVRKAAVQEQINGYGLIFQVMEEDTVLKLRGLMLSLARAGGRDRDSVIPAARIPADFYVATQGILSRLRYRLKMLFST